MGKVMAQLAMSLDGFIADKNDGCETLFGFYDNGDVDGRTCGGLSRRCTCRDERDLLVQEIERTGSTIVGRRLYDITNGWNGHPGDEVPIVVLTHKAPDDWPRGGVPIHFVSDVEAAMSKARRSRATRMSRSQARQRRGRCSTPGSSTRSWSASCR